MKQTIVLPRDTYQAAWAVWLEQFSAQGGVTVYWAEAQDYELLKRLSASETQVDPPLTRPSHKWIGDLELREVQAEAWSWADVLLRLMVAPTDVVALGNPLNWIAKPGQAVVLVAPFARYADFCRTRIHSIAQTRPALVSLHQCSSKVKLLMETTKLPPPPKKF